MAFTALCCIQLVIGLLMFCFGIVDRTAIQVQFSFLMLPIWIGMLVGLAGLCGIIIGYQNKRQGFPNVNTVPAIRALNAMCIGLSIVLFYMYGTILAYFGWRDAYNTSIQNLPYDDPNKKKYGLIPALNIPIDVVTDDETIQGVLSVIMILCLVVMFVGLWMTMLDKEQMMIGTRTQQGMNPLVTNQASQPYFPQPDQSVPPSM